MYRLKSYLFSGSVSERRRVYAISPTAYSPTLFYFSAFRFTTYTELASAFREPSFSA